MKMPTDEIIKLVIKENKVAEVLQLIEQEKKEIISAYESSKPSRSKIC